MGLLSERRQHPCHAYSLLPGFHPDRSAFLAVQPIDPSVVDPRAFALPEGLEPAVARATWCRCQIAQAYPQCGLIPGHPAIPAVWACLVRHRTHPSFTGPKADPKKRTTAHFWTGFFRLLGGLPAACAYPASGPPSAACACGSPPRPGAIAATRPCPSRGTRASTDQTSARSPRACGRSRRRGCRIRLAEGVDDLRFREPALFHGRRPPLEPVMDFRR